MKLLAYLSNNHTATLETDSVGYRIIESTYSWLNPADDRVFYLHSDPHQDGPISVLEFDTNAHGETVGRGNLVTSRCSILRLREM